MKGKKVFKIHSLLGLISGLFILIFCFTGALLVFEEEINSFENPQLHRTSSFSNQLSWQQIYEEIRKQSPDLYLYSYREVPEHPGQSLEMRIYNPKEDRYGLLYANVYTGRVLGVTYNSYFDMLLTLHYTFYLKKSGELLAAIFALCFLGSIITGVYVYRKHFWKALFFQIKISWKNWRKASSGLHRVIGVWALLFNFVLAFSGFYMMLYAFDLKAQFGGESSVKPVYPPTVKTNLDTLIAKTEREIGGKFNYLDFPREESQPVTIYTSGKSFWLFGDFTSYVKYDRLTGEIIKVFRSGDLSLWEMFEYSLYTLHFGQYGGLSIKILYSFFGLASSILAISGYLLYYRRVR